MKIGSIFKLSYKAARSIVFTAVLLVVSLYVLAYVLISIPAFNNYVKNRAAGELTALMGSEVEIGSVRISPFNEVVVNDIIVYDLSGAKCIEIETLGAGISLWKLIARQRIELTYGEIIGLKGNVVQYEKNGPLNISFIIDAFTNKDENKEKTDFDLALRNVVLRKSSLSFRRTWIEEGSSLGSLDLSDLRISEMAADITFPKISNKGIDVDLRRLSFLIEGGIKLQKLAFTGSFSEKEISIKDFELLLAKSRISIPDIVLAAPKDGNMMDALKNEMHHLEIKESYLNPADFAFLYSGLSEFDAPLSLDVTIDGNIDEAEIQQFYFGTNSLVTVNFTGKLYNLSKPSNISGEIKDFELVLPSSTLSKVMPMLKGVSPDLLSIIDKLNDVRLSADISGSLPSESLSGQLMFKSGIAALQVEGETELKRENQRTIKTRVEIENLDLQKILPRQPIGNIKGEILAEGGFLNKEPFGNLAVTIDDFELNHKIYDGLMIDVEKNEEEVALSFKMENEIGDVSADIFGIFGNEIKGGNIEASIKGLDLSPLLNLKSYNGYRISGNISGEGYGKKMEEVEGELLLSGLSFYSEEQNRQIALKKLTLKSEKDDSTQQITINSDWFNLSAEGVFHWNTIASQINNLVSEIIPAFVDPKEYKNDSLSEIDFQLDVKPNNSVPEFFNLPVRLLVPLNIEGYLHGSDNSAQIALDLPYLQQGKDKLIYDTRVFASLDGNEGGLDLIVNTTIPVKKGDLSLDLNLFGESNHISADLGWINTENSNFRGNLSFDCEMLRNYFSGKPELNVSLKESDLLMGEAEWYLNPATLFYTDKLIKVNGLRIWHDDQFVEIDGVASPSYSDVVTIKLADIDVDYIFDTLQINYVTFGGIATGEITGHSLLSSDPVAETDSLLIKDLSYNGALIGDCLASSRWNNEDKEVEITADISKDGHRRVLGKGGIWIGKDSLAFNLLADKVPVEFIQPFMAVFSSHVGGFATGEINLFGTFKDIDMTGRIFADSVAVKLDYTNTIYHGSDSVILDPGRILIPSFRLYDKNGNSALLTGELTHRYFHDPSFSFRLSGAEDFLCYDTSAEINPDWYGLLYGTGSAYIEGVPGIVNISADMTITGNSSFTFVLNETQYAQDYQFLTFTDKRAEELKARQNLPIDFKSLFKKKVAEEAGGMSKFGIDIRATVTPSALFTLVMDPKAGDKITARGRGAMQVKYESDNDEMQMYGKYEIDEGNYNFSLQDIILRDFKIKEGSYISFNGNPLRADLDISAAYRVNTNLSDLDKSFSNDRDLTRTNVPVDAILAVKGNMQHPDITFDIELPTLTQDVERKVKSIISTDDMMNRQIIYLLALNRFYTPEYMGSGSNGGELAAVASSTISSQLSNILGQLTDKVAVSPSFRSDKGDFSDIEVDVALSSRLLNNRLLINGNFGYRDRSNSSTTFIGDFDVEYLLSKNGNLRLKAYNHFNDQNYYLREALTTQGLGIIWRRDFDHFFNFLKKKDLKEK